MTTIDRSAPVGHDATTGLVGASTLAAALDVLAYRWVSGAADATEATDNLCHIRNWLDAQEQEPGPDPSICPTLPFHMPALYCYRCGTHVAGGIMGDQGWCHECGGYTTLVPF